MKGHVGAAQRRPVVFRREDEDESYLEILSDLTNEPLEGKLPDKQLSGLLVTPDFTKGDGSGAEPVGLLDTSSGSL
jgi:hypothetical protein